MISAKQNKIRAFPYSSYDALICDGAVRSGKTSIMMVTFVKWAMDSFNGRKFGICGKTVDSAIKNIIDPFLMLSWAKERYSIKWRRQEKVLEVRRGNTCNIFEVFGGKDEASFMLIQGRTLAGVLLDEVVLMPESFVNQALARCSVDGARIWFSCNPGSPEHWFYKKWILGHEERNALYLHFTMQDNPSLSAKTLERYETMYSGVFYDRYILGKWVAAEGLIYPMFGESCQTDDIPESGDWFISCDYGTLNPFSAGLWRVDDKRAVRVREYYYNGREQNAQKTDEEYYAELEKLAGEMEIESVIVDPSAASFIETIRRHGRFSVRKANNDVKNGIITTARFLQNGKIKVNRACKDAIREFGLYRWDEKATDDRPIKENDHAMDDIRYFCQTVLRFRLADNEDSGRW
jgi:PBSX family phage terminase large subunit